MANTAFDACEAAAAEGLDCEMIDLRSLKPLDIDCVLESVRKTGRLLLASEGCENSNFVCEIAMRNTNAGSDREAGVRAVGSSLDRRLKLRKPEFGGTEALHQRSLAALVSRAASAAEGGERA